jgi:CheY-like chemotaxis protein
MPNAKSVNQPDSYVKPQQKQVEIFQLSHYTVIKLDDAAGPLPDDPGRRTILLVDDEEIVIEVGQEILERLGYQVLVAASGEEAIATYREHKNVIDLVILDMIMHHMTGMETYDTLKKEDPNIFVLLSSGYSIDGQATEILKHGCNGFIQKPFSMADLSQKVEDLLSNHTILGTIP